MKHPKNGTDNKIDAVPSSNAERCWPRKLVTSAVEAPGLGAVPAASEPATNSATAINPAQPEKSSALAWRRDAGVPLGSSAERSVVLIVSMVM